MKTLVLSLATICVLVAGSTASAAVAVRVGPVGVAVGRGVPRRTRPVHVAPRPVRRAAVTHNRRSTALQIGQNRRGAFQDVVEDRHDAVGEIREERVDRAAEIIEARQRLWEMLQASQP